MSRRLSPKQRAALEAVAAGRVTYGDHYPKLLARRVADRERRAAAGEMNRDIIGEERPIVTNPRALASCEMHVDGAPIYGAEHLTYASLSERGLIDDYPNPDGTARVVTLTDAGRAALPRLVTLPCTQCGEPMEVPAGATSASHGARCIVARESRERMTRRA